MTLDVFSVPTTVVLQFYTSDHCQKDNYFNSPFNKVVVDTAITAIDKRIQISDLYCTYNKIAIG